jgi:hypothetical protein
MAGKFCNMEEIDGWEWIIGPQSKYVKSKKKEVGAGKMQETCGFLISQKR